MKLSFAQFQFDLEQQLLSQQGKIVPLNDKATQLLMLFLKHPNELLSKAHILDTVWPGRVVSDQVIFQNISQLRTLFGPDSIKTFSKKGYQWQLDVAPFQPEAPLVKPTAQIDIAPKKYRPRSKHLLIIALFIISTLSLLTVMLNNEGKSTLKQERVILIDTQSPDTSILVPLKAQTLFDSPYVTWQKYAPNKQQWLVASRWYPMQSGGALRFHIQGEKRRWQDHIYASNKTQATQQLQQLLNMLSTTQYFTLNNDMQALALLQVLRDKKDNNTLLAQQLAQLYFKLNELDTAEVAASVQITAASSELQQGLAYLLKAKISQWDQQWSTARHDVDAAIALFRQLQLAHLESQALIESSWLYLVNQQFREAIAVLNQAVSKARESNEPLLEVTAHLTQSFMASKSGQTELMYAQLSLAKELIKLHQLAEVHHVPVLSHLAWIAATEKEALPHYVKLLDYAYSAKYDYDFHNAASHVRDIYITQQQWQKVLGTIKSWQRPSFAFLTKTHVAMARGQTNSAIEYALNAYNQALLAHHKVDALDAALLLAKLNISVNNQTEANKFIQYIKTNATRRWRSQNQLQLTQIEKSST